MTHNLHILLGNCAEQNISHIKKYVIKYGAEYVDKNGISAQNYLQFMLYDDNGQFYLAEKKNKDSNVFVTGIDDSFDVELIPISEPMSGDDSAKRLIYFFSNRFTSTVNMNNRGDGNLHVCIHVPLYSEEAWAKAETLMAAIAATGSNYTVDLMLMASDLAFLTTDDTQLLAEKSDELIDIAKGTLQKIVDVKTSMKYSVLNSLILVQNHNESGIALDLNHESYANLIGEYALSVAVDYNNIFTAAFLYETKQSHPILGLGFSMLNFDRYYFVQYLLRKAYNHILDREQVTQEKVDVNKAANIVQNVLINNIDIFTNLYEKQVKSMVYDQKMAENDIMAQIEPVIQAELDRVEKECTQYMDDEELTLPEKRATLAQLLGEDDPLLEGVQYNTEQLILDECRNDVMTLFVDSNNAIASMSEEALDDAGVPIREHAVLSTIQGEPIEMVKNRINRIKNLKLQIKTGTDYIRREEEVLSILEKDIQVEKESHKRLTPDGFQFGDQVYRLNPKNIERPLEETYTPVTGKLPSEADIRADFTCIKNQGSLGSCTSFAIVSVYEYFVKRDQKREIDLSELFAYQNARVRMPEEEKTNEGASIYHLIKGMGEDGICLEELHPYKVENLPEPSEEAKEDAQSRKITKALNVNCNLHDFKSAISQGYPIVISLRLFESFAQSTGFVPRPTDDERKLEEHSYHAMVVCGYSDAEHVFIVRNSWGTQFGDKGYCYIPYSYITDPELMVQACVITEISEAEVKVMENVRRISVSFNKEDAMVQAAIKRTLIDEERIHVDELKAELRIHRDDYYALAEDLGKPSNRDKLRIGTEKRLKWEIERLKERKYTLEAERVDRLDDFDGDTNKLWIFTGISVVAVLAIYTILTIIFSGFQLSFWVTGITLLGILSLVATPHLFKRTRQFVTSENEERFNSNVSTIWIVSIAIGVVALLVAIFFLDYFEPVASWYSHNLFTTLVLSLLLFIPFASVFICRRGIREALDEKYIEDIQRVARNIAIREDMKSVTKLRTHIAGRILDSLTALISRLRKKYYGTRTYVNNLNRWRYDNDDELDMQPINRQPFMSLIDNECLNKYFDTYADQLTQDVRLYKLLANKSDIGDEQIIAFKNDIKKSVADKLWDSVEDFSIYDHVVGNKQYEYVDNNYTNLQSLISTMDNNSEIFVRTTMRMNDTNATAVRSKMLFRSAPGNNGAHNWDQNIASMFSTMPTMHDIASDKKIFMIRLEGLNPEEIDMLR